MDRFSITRRDLMASAAALASPVPARSSAPPGNPWFTPPFRLLGKRLVFTSWFYVRAGGFQWLDENGKAVGPHHSLDSGRARFRQIDIAQGIRLCALPARRVGPLLEPEKPWEEDAGLALATVFKDGGVYRGWGTPFTTSGDPRGQSYTYYLESHDGLSWKRPSLGIIDYHGSRNNNLVIAPMAPFKHRIFSGTVFIDPAAPASERYKMFGLGNVVTNGLMGAFSPDGLRWTVLAEPLVVEPSDTQVVAYYDVRLRQYVAYTRTRVFGKRSIGRSQTPDFRRFPVSETIIQPGVEVRPSDTYYTNCRTTIPGAPDHHLMFPAIWHGASDTTSIAMAGSYDGRHWEFLHGSPVFTTPPFGEWDGGCVFSHPNLIELPDGDFALPYTGYTVPHKYPRGQWKFRPGYMTWPKGRIVMIEALQRGEFATLDLIPPGRKLRLNVATSRAGAVLVEVAAKNGQSLPGRSFADVKPVLGDHLAAPVAWGGSDDLGHTDGEAVFLRFRLNEARLFGLDFD